MKKSFSLITIVALAGLLVQCAHKGDKKLEGIWQLNSMSMNGTRISGTDLGIWLWEFNEEGGYLTIVAGAKEKGITAGIAIGGTVWLLVLFGGPVSGTSLNPTRSLAPALVMQNFQAIWVYLIAPFAGALSAVLVHRLLHTPEN